MGFRDLEDRIYFTSSDNDNRLVQSKLELHGNDNSPYKRLADHIYQRLCEDRQDPCMRNSNDVSDLHRITITGENRKMVFPYIFQNLATEEPELLPEVELASNVRGREFGRLEDLSGRIDYKIDTDDYRLEDFL